MSMKFNRRSMLRGSLFGASMVVGIPTLDCFLDGNGRAYADGTKLPVRMGTYFWGLGLTPGRWVPEKYGADYGLAPEIESLGDLRKKTSVFSDFRVMLDGKGNIQHWTGQGAIMTGLAPSKVGTFDRISFDVEAADQLGSGMRFRSIEMTPFGSPKLSYSTRSGTGFNTPETSPVALYTRLFGEGFQDPNNPNWKPDPQMVLRKSVLSSVAEQRQALVSSVGAEDKQKLDQYFTSVRAMEQQIAAQLQRPARADACVVPTSPTESKRAGQIDVVNGNNKLMAELTAMALACNQTRIFNVVHSSATSETYLPGDTSIYHSHTHGEVNDPKLGYQVISSKLATFAFEAYADYLRALDGIKEGDGTLLDNCAVMGYSDTGFAKNHTTENIPMFIAGGAGGKHKPKHVKGNNDPVSRVSLTLQQLVGLPVGEYGIGAMKTAKPISEVIA